MLEIWKFTKRDHHVKLIKQLFVEKDEDKLKQQGFEERNACVRSALQVKQVRGTWPSRAG